MVLATSFYHYHSYHKWNCQSKKGRNNGMIGNLHSQDHQSSMFNTHNQIHLVIYVLKLYKLNRSSYCWNRFRMSRYRMGILHRYHHHRIHLSKCKALNLNHIICFYLSRKWHTMWDLYKSNRYIGKLNIILSHYQHHSIYQCKDSLMLEDDEN